MSEHDEQAALFDWAAYQQTPELAMLFAIPNGGDRHILVAKKMRREGVKAGIPDIFLAVPREDYHGLFIEMKFDKNRPTKHQIWWLKMLEVHGYKTAVCWNWEAATEVIEEYLGQE